MSDVVHILTGPTACGKSALALEWACLHGAEVLSCDALQVYRAMDIGTAKPTLPERVRVRHHLIDVAEVDEPFSVKAFSLKAFEAAQDVFSRGKKLLVVGGSGFYLKSFYTAVADEVAVPETIANEVQDIEARQGIEGLRVRLEEFNPDGLGNLDTQNPRRLVSALKRCLASGKTLAQLRAEFEKLNSPFDNWPRKTVLLQRGADSLKQRAHARAKKMIQDGLVDEVRALLPRLKKNPSAASAIGYREVIEWLEGGQARPLEVLAEKIGQDTCALLRKQRTWFNHQITPDKVLNLDETQPDLQTLFE